METGEFCVYLDKGVYRTWHAIGVLEDLTSDEDIAQFLVTLYSSGKQREGEESSLRCVDCHCPLTLYCSTCHRPSHLTIPPQPPPPSLSSPPPPPPPQVSDPSAPVSVPTHTDHSPDWHQHGFSNSVKDEENVAGDQNEVEDGDFEDCSFELDIVKTESTVDGCDLGSGFSEPVVNFRLTPSNVAGSGRSQKGRGRKSNAVSDRGKKKGSSTSTSSTSESKAAKRKRTDKNKRSSNSLTTCCKIEDMKRVSEDVASDFEDAVSVEVDDYENSVKESCNDASPEKSAKESKKKRKPCASHDLAEGQILSAGERRMAHVHVYDDTFFERHRIEDDPLRRPGRRKKTKESQKSAKSAPQKRRRKILRRRHTSSSPANSDSSNTDKEVAGYYGHDAQTDRCSPTNCQQKKTVPLTTQTNDCKLIQSEHAEDFAHDASASKSESSKRTADSDSLSLSILVSAQKILPQRTTDGNYARFLYSYFECAHCRKAFTHKRAFNTHVQTHAGQNSDSCAMICERGSTEECSHNGLLKPKGRATLQCEICGVPLKSLYALRFHIAAIHENARPFKCGLCDKSFVVRTKLRSHVKYKHAEGGRLFHCDQCSYRAFDARGLKVHQTCVHSKERPFRCTFCPSAFALKFYLDVHLRKHTGEKPFGCPECSQRFAQRPSLTRHMRNYHGAQPASGGGRKEAGSSDPS